MNDCSTYCIVTTNALEYETMFFFFWKNYPISDRQTRNKWEEREKQNASPPNKWNKWPNRRNVSIFRTVYSVSWMTDVSYIVSFAWISCEEPLVLFPFRWNGATQIDSSIYTHANTYNDGTRNSLYGTFHSLHKYGIASVCTCVGYKSKYCSVWWSWESSTIKWFSDLAFIEGIIWNCPLFLVIAVPHLNKLEQIPLNIKFGRIWSNIVWIRRRKSAFLQLTLLNHLCRFFHHSYDN